MELVKNINKHIFRAYDIRGIYETDIDVNVAYTLGKSLGSYIQNLGKKKIIVGHDNRESSPELSVALIEGLKSTGVLVVNIGLVTTPMYYFAWLKLNIFSGAMITASHNPKEYNGFKIAFDERGNARGEMIQDFREFTQKSDFKEGKGREIHRDISRAYLKLIKKSICFGKRKIKVIIDAGNATGSVIVKRVFDMFKSKIDVKYIFCESDSSFPNHHPDPSIDKNLDALKQQVLKEKADLGIALDGDADRAGFVDHAGNTLPIDYFMIIIWRDIIDKVKNKTALFDVKCSKSLPDEVIKLGGEICCYRTGNSYMKTKMIEEDFSFGGELSGHMWFRDRYKNIDDGIYAGLRLIEILSKTDKNIPDLLEGINKYFATPEILFPCPDDKKNDVVEKVKKYVKEKEYNINEIDGVRVEFIDGWALVRASGTGPNLTLRFEGITEIRRDELKEEFMKVIEG